MRMQIEKDLLLQRILIASRFTSDKLHSGTALQGILFDVKEKKLFIYATDLNTYYHTKIDVDTEDIASCVVEPQRIIEFLQLLQAGTVEVEFNENTITFVQGKTKGQFPVLSAQDFPLPPEITEATIPLKTSLFTDTLPFILFTASSDDSRPVLTGVNFVNTDEEFIIVSTDGFRLSIFKEKQKGEIASMIIPADFLRELLKNIRSEKEIQFCHSTKEHMVRFETAEGVFYSRLIDGEFPPFEKVIPAEKKTTVTVKKDELMRNVKLISIFARDFSNVVVCEFEKGNLTIRPKKEGNKENTTSQDIVFEGEPQQVAFNYKYLIEFLNHCASDNVIIEILRTDAPIVFKAEGNETFFHIIMPIRIQE
ncbi:MAG: DNA polymerase III subunit beta [Weeksellaceae bacterium]